MQEACKGCFGRVLFESQRQALCPMFHIVIVSFALKSCLVHSLYDGSSSVNYGFSQFLEADTYHLLLVRHTSVVSPTSALGCLVERVDRAKKMTRPQQ